MDNKKRLEELRAELRAERMSYGEQVELQELADYIEPGDVELLEAAGVPEGEQAYRLCFLHSTMQPLTELADHYKGDKIEVENSEGDLEDENVWGDYLITHHFTAENDQAAKAYALDYTREDDTFSCYRGDNIAFTEEDL